MTECAKCHGTDTSDLGFTASKATTGNAIEIRHLGYCHACDIEFEIPIDLLDLNESIVSQILDKTV